MGNADVVRFGLNVVVGNSGVIVDVDVVLVELKERRKENFELKKTNRNKDCSILRKYSLNNNLRGGCRGCSCGRSRSSSFGEMWWVLLHFDVF